MRWEARACYETNGHVGDLKKLLGGEVDVEQVAQERFEEQYKKVMDAVKQAGKGEEARVFRVTVDETRAEYYVVAVDVEQGKLVGLKALSVES